MGNEENELKLCDNDDAPVAGLGRYFSAEACIHVGLGEEGRTRQLPLAWCAKQEITRARRRARTSRTAQSTESTQHTAYVLPESRPLPMLHARLTACNNACILIRSCREGGFNRCCLHKASCNFLPGRRPLLMWLATLPGEDERRTIPIQRYARPWMQEFACKGQLSARISVPDRKVACKYFLPNTLAVMIKCLPNTLAMVIKCLPNNLTVLTVKVLHRRIYSTLPTGCTPRAL